MKTIGASLAALACLGLFTATPRAAPDPVDTYITSRLPALHIPGLSLAVVRDGRIVKARGYGLANLELQVPATSRTVYEIGSTTKQFTATAVMMLAAEGKIGLDDPVRRYFPDAPESWGRITLRHLLTHTSGIQNHVAVPGYMDVFKSSLSMELFPSRDELLRMFFKLPLEFEPGATWSYDNTGYYLLGIVVEKASGMPFWEFLDARIFKPLGMGATRNTDRRVLVPHRASGYEWVGRAFQNRPVLEPAVAFSAGSLLSTVEDLAKWDAALAAGKLLSRETLDRMWSVTPTADGAVAPFPYGFGWFADAYRGRRLVQHSGGTPGFSSTFYRFLDDRLSVIILTNHSDRVLDQLAIDIAGMFEPGLKRSEGHDAEPDVSRATRTLVSELMKGHHEPARFTQPMQAFLGTATGRGYWQWIAAHGDLRSLTFSEEEVRVDGRVRRYRAVLGGNPYWLSVRLDPHNKISGIWWW